MHAIVKSRFLYKTEKQSGNFCLWLPCLQGVNVK